MFLFHRTSSATLSRSIVCCIAIALPACIGCTVHPMQSIGDLIEHGAVQGDAHKPTGETASNAAKDNDPNNAAARISTAQQLGFKDHDRELLADRSWQRATMASPSLLLTAGTLDESVENNSTASFRWQHKGLQEIADRERSPRAIFAKFAADANSELAVTAAIGLSRYYDPSDRSLPEQLAAAVNNPALLTTQRCAAAEAIGHIGSLEGLQALVDRQGQFQKHSGILYQGDLHAELLCALARRSDAADDPRFLAALESPAPTVRVAALDAFAASRRGTLPTAAVDLRSDLDPHVRAAAFKAIAARNTPGARDDLAAALHDVDLDVRLAAVSSLAQLGDGASKALVGEVLSDHSELMRAEAVASLARCGQRPSVLGAKDDKSWRVRIKVAQALAEYADEEGSATARKFLTDMSPAVEQQAVLATAHWPKALAGPVLFAALDLNVLSTRKTAAEEVARRWPELGRFPYTATPQRRSEALAELQVKFHSSNDVLPATAIQSAPGVVQASATTSTTIANDPQQIDQVVRWLAAGDWPALAGLGPGLLPLLDMVAFDRQQTLPEDVYRQVLPPMSPAFMALDRLHRGVTANDATLRRAASEELAIEAKKQPLGCLAVARLASISNDERDSLVWLNVLESITSDGSEAAVRLRRVALGHPAAEVRRRACVQMAAFPSAAHAPFLLPLLDDNNRSVRLAAIDALGLAGRAEDTAPLKRLLIVNDPEEQLTLAVALARLHDPSYSATIEQVSYSSDAKIRCQVAHAIGLVGDPSQTGTLIRFLDDNRLDVRRAALESLTRLAGRDIGRADDGSPLSPDEQVRRWKQWFASGAAGATRVPSAM